MAVMGIAVVAARLPFSDFRELIVGLVFRAVLVAVALGPRMDSVVILAETLGLRRGRFGRFPTVAVAALRLLRLLPVAAAVSTVSAVSAGTFARLEGLAIILFILDAVVELALVAAFSLPEHLEMLDVGQLVLILVIKISSSSQGVMISSNATSSSASSIRPRAWTLRKNHKTLGLGLETLAELGDLVVFRFEV
jgi:hypothetical protein